jgi:hypothetical protein
MLIPSRISIPLSLRQQQLCIFERWRQSQLHRCGCIWSHWLVAWISALNWYEILLFSWMSFFSRCVVLSFSYEWRKRPNVHQNSANHYFTVCCIPTTEWTWHLVPQRLITEVWLEISFEIDKYKSCSVLYVQYTLNHTLFPAEETRNLRAVEYVGVTNIISIFYSYTVHYQMCRDWPTNALSCMLLYLHEGCYMFRQNNAILREQLGAFLSYFNVNMVGGESWNIWYTSRSICQRVMQLTVMERYPLPSLHIISIVTYGRENAIW